MTLIAGVGFVSTATTSEILEALGRVGDVPDMIAVPEHRSGSAALQAAAAILNVPVLSIELDDVRGVETRTRSPRVVEMYGTGSIAEAVALVAAGEGGYLVTPRLISSDRSVTAALVRMGEQA